MPKYVFKTEYELTHCGHCPMFNRDFEFCNLHNEWYVDYDFDSMTFHMPDWCPLVELEQEVSHHTSKDGGLKAMTD